MIVYHDIDAEDVVRYWGREGVVFMRSNGATNAYTVVSAEDDNVQLQLSEDHIVHGNPPKLRILSNEEFFAKVTLHRPPLGVLVSKGVLISWAHANGNLSKAVRNAHVMVLPIPDVVDNSSHSALYTEWCSLFAEAVRAYRSRGYRARDDTPFFTHELSRYGNDNDNPGSINHVLEFLNQEQVSLKEALSRKAHSFLGNVQWVLYDPEQDKHYLYLATRRIGQVSAEGGLSCESSDIAEGKIARLLFNSLNVGE